MAISFLRFECGQFLHVHKEYRNNLHVLEAFQIEIRSVLCNMTEDEQQQVSESFSRHCQMFFIAEDTTFSSFFKIQVSTTESYNINREVAPMLVRFIGCSLVMHWLWQGKAMHQLLLKCGSVRSVLTVSLDCKIHSGFTQNFAG
jgi:hypothetical protein